MAASLHSSSNSVGRMLILAEFNSCTGELCTSCHHPRTTISYVRRPTSTTATRWTHDQWQKATSCTALTHSCLHKSCIVKHTYFNRCEMHYLNETCVVYTRRYCSHSTKRTGVRSQNFRLRGDCPKMAVLLTRVSQKQRVLQISMLSMTALKIENCEKCLVFANSVT